MFSSLPGNSIAPPPILAPDTLKGIDDLIHSGFEAYRTTCFNWLLAATVLVVIGLVFEGPELWHEITSIIGLRRRSHFSIPESHPPDWAKLIAFIGWLLIVVGVAGEYVADSFVSKADGYVQTLDEILLAEAQQRTVLASKRAGTAYERAALAERETTGLQLQIAQANERAESEHLERVKLETQLLPRRLSSTQIDVLADKLKPFAASGQIYIIIVSAALDPESSDFAKDFETAFEAGGWKPTITTWDQMIVRGLDLGMLEDPSNPDHIPAQFVPVVQAVHGAIVGIGVSCNTRALKPDDPVSLNKPEKSVLYLLVHHKPEVVPNEGETNRDKTLQHGAKIPPPPRKTG